MDLSSVPFLTNLTDTEASPSNNLIPSVGACARFFTGRGNDINTVPEYADPEQWPDPTGLCLGILSVVVGQALVILYFYFARKYFKQLPIQLSGMPEYDFREAVVTHLAEPGGFFLLGSYLAGTWMFKLMPASYYSLEGSIQWQHVLCQLVLTDLTQTFAHLGEHKINPTLYKNSHKPHHRFINPRWADAYNGSVPDTICMILVPLFITANIVHCNVWSYMAFGTIYSGYLTMIHSEFAHAWDPLFRALGIATAGDHHVHHRTFVWNYGHIFTYWDRLLGTYKSPLAVKVFSKDV